MMRQHADEVCLPLALQQYQLELPNQANKKRALESILQHHGHTGQIAILVRATESVLQLSRLVSMHDWTVGPCKRQGWFAVVCNAHRVT